jgi:hypothetical protein
MGATLENAITILVIVATASGGLVSLYICSKIFLIYIRAQFSQKFLGGRPFTARNLFRLLKKELHNESKQEEDANHCQHLR